MILYDPAFGMPHLGSSNCGCQKIYKAVLLRVGVVGWCDGAG